MKFFTKELWLGAQKVSQFKDIHPQYQEAEKAYRAQLNSTRVSNPPSQAAEPVVKCGYGSSDERSPGKTTDTGRDSADCGGVCN
jgi:hypothetical protein